MNQSSVEVSKLIGINLRGLRLRCGFTQKQIARTLGVSFQQVQKYETGQNRLPIEKLMVLRALYGADYESFFYGVDPQAETGSGHSIMKPCEIVGRLERMDNKPLQRKIYAIINILLS